MSIWYPYYDKEIFGDPIQIERGEGAYLFDKDGKKYIDAISSWWTNIHGHAHPYIAEKVSEQLNKLEHVIFSGFTHEPALKLAERLLKLLPSNQKKIFYSDNGSTAVEVALKMAIQYYINIGSKRSKIIALKNSYHGDTFGAMSVSGRSTFNSIFENFLFEVDFIDVDDKAGSQLYDILKKESDNVAAFIFEPLVMGTSGMKMYPKSIADELLLICKDFGVLTIADEVMTGFCRTGTMFACDQLSQNPDIMCLSKGITGGTMALGVTSCTKEIYDSFENKSIVFFHGHSYTANPLACAAANANLDLFKLDQTSLSIENICTKHLTFSESFQIKYPMHEVRVEGTILAIELNTNENTSYFNSIRKKAYHFFLQKGIIMRPLGNTIYVMPPYCISDTDLDYIYNSINEFIDGI